MPRSTWAQTCWQSRGGDRFRFRGTTIYLCYGYAREQDGPHGYEGNFKALRVPAGMHGSPDLVERREQVAQFVSQFGGVVALPR
jgi:hypothetical protein